MKCKHASVAFSFKTTSLLLFSFLFTTVLQRPNTPNFSLTQNAEVISLLRLSKTKTTVSKQFHRENAQQNDHTHRVNDKGYPTNGPKDENKC
mmetsp:Transcript_32041/g.49000  ORF Transcript_32041/g.49000 Transcript_32041/m.49000 type:complete len:92 (-) Transcript_32041:424-699(-)